MTDNSKYYLKQMGKNQLCVFLGEFLGWNGWNMRLFIDIVIES